MADEKPSLHIDTDWKRQAQEEKKRLVEAEAKKAQEASKPAVVGSTAPVAGLGSGAPQAAAPRGRDPREGGLTANILGLVQTMLSQVLYYLGDLAARGGESTVNLDMAKYQIDMLGVLEDKTRGNLTDDEKSVLDTALYETRMRFVNVASQYV